MPFVGLNPYLRGQTKAARSILKDFSLQNKLIYHNFFNDKAFKINYPPLIGPPNEGLLNH